MKKNRDTAKKCGNYQRSSKNYRHGTKVGTVYDHNVWVAEDALKKRKERLAEAKMALRDAKKS